VIFYHRFIIELIALTIHNGPLYEKEKTLSRRFPLEMSAHNGFEGPGQWLPQARKANP